VFIYLVQESTRTILPDGHAMHIIDIINRKRIPIPWDEGDNIPWNDAHISWRMLGEHLSQAHDSASRRVDTIEQHIQWIHETILQGKTSRILDLACGPGLYTTRLALQDHKCVGIDYSPASIIYAIEQADLHDIACTYLHEDIRTAVYGSDFDLVLLIFGEFNVFKTEDASVILRKIYDALLPGGSVILECHTYEGVKKLGLEDRSWDSVHQGLFSEQPYLCLEESVWNRETHTTTIRYYIINAESAAVTRHAQTIQAYSHEEYTGLLESCGFRNISFEPSLRGTHDPSQEGLIVIHAEKGPGSYTETREEP